MFVLCTSYPPLVGDIVSKDVSILASKMGGKKTLTRYPGEHK